MPARQLPARPDLDQYRKQAKELVKAWRAADADALGRVERHHPRRLSAMALADAHLVIAREHGFETWPAFAAHIHARIGDETSAIWRAAARAIVDADAPALEWLLRQHAALFAETSPPPYAPSGAGPSYTSGDARAIIAREHELESWDAVVALVEARREEGSMVARFEAAVEALIDGDVDRLDRLLTETPSLVHARSTRRHHATLLHYVGANGVEGFRQRTPKTIVQAAALLLGRGADIDARAPMYGGSATLGLIATSIHPVRAGVLEPLVELFLDHGAADDPALVAGCLANGRGEAATLLARRGARLTLEGAAGVGRLDEVKRFFTTDGGLGPDATPQQLLDGFTWACEFGHSLVVDFLLQRGVAVDARVKHHKQTGLHWAAAGGHLATVRVLLARQAPIDAPDGTWGHTPLGWALHGWGGDDHSTTARARYHAVVAVLVTAGASVKPEWRADPQVQADPDMLAALDGRAPG